MNEIVKASRSSWNPMNPLADIVTLPADISPGDYVRDKAGKFVGLYVEQLTDFLCRTPESLKKLRAQESHGFIEMGRDNPVQYEYWGLRKVYSQRFGSCDQALVDSFGDLHWINLGSCWRIIGEPI